MAPASKVDFDQIDACPTALRLLLLVFLQSVSRHLVGRRHELDHRNHATPRAQVDDLKKALDDRFRLGGKNDRLRQGDSACWLDGQLARPKLHNANVGADPAAVARRGIFNDKTFLDSGNKALAQLSLKLVRRFNDKPRVDVQPMGFKVRVHAGKRASHSHILIEQKQTSNRVRSTAQSSRGEICRRNPLPARHLRPQAAIPRPPPKNFPRHPLTRILIYG